MLKFSQFIITEARRSDEKKGIISPSRKRYLDKQREYTREGKFKAQLPEYTDEELDDHIAKHYPYGLRDKVKNSAHDPKAPIDMTRPIPESVRALGRTAVYHFNAGVAQKTEAINDRQVPDDIAKQKFNEGHRHVRAAIRVMRTHLGDPYADFLKKNETRQNILPKLFAKDT